jgi:alpha-L-fucosidase
MPNGKIQPEFTDTLNAVGAWMQKNGQSVYGTRGNIIPPQQWGVVTGKSKTLYVHILDMPEQPYIFLPLFKGKIEKVQALADGSGIKYKQVPEGVFVYTNNLKTDPNDTIIQITTD